MTVSRNATGGTLPGDPKIALVKVAEGFKLDSCMPADHRAHEHLVGVGRTGHAEDLCVPLT